MVPISRGNLNHLGDINREFSRCVWSGVKIKINEVGGIKGGVEVCGVILYVRLLSLMGVYVISWNGVGARQYGVVGKIIGHTTNNFERFAAEMFCM